MIGWPIGRFISYPIAYLSPGAKSFRAVMTNRSGDDTRWLAYWLVVAWFMMFEVLLPHVLVSFPFYYECKCLLLLYLQSDCARPAYRLYRNAIGPFLKIYESRIDAFLNTYSNTAVDFARTASKAGKRAFIEAAVDGAGPQ
jgi:receptor expression-enhancing protein 5/6